MIVKLKLVNGAVELFETEKYSFVRIENMHPDILEAYVISDTGKVLTKIKRRRQKHYIKHEYKPLPVEGKKEAENKKEA